MVGILELWRALTRDRDVAGDEAPGMREHDDTADPPGAELDELDLDTVGAWAGASSMSSPATAREAVAFAKSIGLRRLDLIVNDHSRWRSSSAFNTYPDREIFTLAAEADRAGLGVHLLSWIMPHRGYIAGAGEQLRRLVELTGATSIVLDAEEPWTKASSPLPYAQAAELVASELDGIAWGVTGIGYASVAKLGPLCSRAVYLVPQCYATRTSGLSPSTVVPRLVARWRAVFPAKPIAIGLAAYRQDGIPGYTAEAAMRAAFGGALADPHARTAIYWSLAAIKSSKVATRTLRSLLVG